MAPAESVQRVPESQQSSGIQYGALMGVAAMVAVVGGLRRQSRHRRRWSSVVACKAEAEPVVQAFEDPETGEKNYVNPWEQRVDEAEFDSDAMPVPSGWKFHSYGGPVYKQVPVAEGLQFPLDPKLYYPPLEPPPTGGKWGDGRSPDGNWYMDVEGKQVQYWQGWGRRKTACAIVRIVKGTGQFIINGRDAIEYFQNYPIWWLKACEPLAALSVKNDFDLLCKAFGGGKSGQAGAIRLAAARAMQEHNFNWRPLLKRAKYLTRDWRMVEPKKTGRPKARKKTPYHKR